MWPQKWDKDTDFMEKRRFFHISILLAHFWTRKEYFILFLYSLSFNFLCIVIWYR